MKKQKWTREEVADYWKSRGRPDSSNPEYRNKEDGNLVVRKANGLGWTLNLGNPRAFGLIGGVLIVVLALCALAGT